MTRVACFAFCFSMMTAHAYAAPFVLRGERGTKGATGAKGSAGTNGTTDLFAASCPAGDYVRSIDPAGVVTCAKPSATLAAPATRTYIVRAYDFEPFGAGDAQAWTRTFDGMTRGTAQATTMSALLHLPQGAILSSFRCAVGTGAVGDISLSLKVTRGNSGTPTTTHCTGQNSAGQSKQVIGQSSPQFWDVACQQPVAYDTSTGGYRVYSLELTTSQTDSTMFLYACEVAYTISSMFP